MVELLIINYDAIIIITGLGLMCYVCEFVRAGDESVGDSIRDFSGSQNYRCRTSDMSEITPTRCQVDEVCYSMKVDVIGVDGKFTTHTYTHSADTERRPYTVCDTTPTRCAKWV